KPSVRRAKCDQFVGLRVESHVETDLRKPMMNSFTAQPAPPSPSASNLMKPWRVWIPLLLLPLMPIARLIPGMIEDAPANIWMVSAFGPVLVSLAIVLWFCAVSRARWWERLVGVICIVIILVVML